MTEKRSIGTFSRFLAWVLALMLVPLMTGTLYGWIALRVATDQKLHERIALRDSVIDDQMDQIEKKARLLGEAYQFDPQMVTDILNREALLDLNRQVVIWWTDMCSTGVPENMPLWDGEPLRQNLLSNEAFVETHGALARDTAGKTISAINSLLSRLMFPMRELLITEGLEWVRRKVALSELIDLAQGIPLTLTLMSAATIGLIMLLTFGNGLIIQRHFGSALGGAGILSLCILGLIWALNPGGLIQESSVRFAEQVKSLQIIMSVEALAVILLMLAGGWAMLRNAGKIKKKSGGEPG